MPALEQTYRCLGPTHTHFMCERKSKTLALFMSEGIGGGGAAEVAGMAAQEARLSTGSASEATAATGPKAAPVVLAPMAARAEMPAAAPP